MKTSQIEVFDKINKQLDDNLPFVIYRKPGKEVTHALFQNNNEVYFGDGLSASGFVFAPFQSSEETYLIPTENAESFHFTPELAVEMPAGTNIDPGVFNFAFREEDQKAHEVLVQKGIDVIKEGKLKKVVLARSEKVNVHDPDAVRILKSMLEKYVDAFVYLWFHPKTGIWLGASPETLLSTERTKFRTMALAGTQLYRKEDIVWGDKEKEEQAMVSRYIQDSLESLKEVKNITISEPYTSRAGNLIHIRTDISGQMNSENDLSVIIKNLHPTPAICGLPKNEALQFILNNETHHRDYYSGYLGEINLKTEVKRNSNRNNQENQQFAAISKRTEIFVNLRCMKLSKGNATVYIGGGITKDSNAAEEWMETVNKAQTMRAVLIR